jgi:hypothetical protein
VLLQCTAQTHCLTGESAAVCVTGGTELECISCESDYEPDASGVCLWVACFPADASVDVFRRGATRMDALRVGDAVLTVGYSGLVEYNEVYFFGRRHGGNLLACPYHVLEAHAGGGAAALQLPISATHFVPVTAAAEGWCNGSLSPASANPPTWSSHRMMLARDVAPGMVLWRTTAAGVGGAPMPTCVTSNQRATHGGSYLPYVRARAIVVDSVAASPHSRNSYMALYRWAGGRASTRHPFAAFGNSQRSKKMP